MSFIIRDKEGQEPLLALVVDDDADINRLLQVRLRGAGFEVRSALDGEAALEEIESEQPDLILLDVSMPGIGGLEVLSWIREKELDIAVIMTTAFGSEVVAIDALRQGADDYLRKPFETAEFRAVVDRTTSRLVLRRQNERLREQLDAELRRASIIQTQLLPSKEPELEGYEIAMACVPAHVVGGDFYDWRKRDDGVLALALGDVMGKGMPAALLMATVRAALRPTIAINDPARAITLVSEAIEEDLARTESFVTLVLLTLDPRSHRVEYVDAGHGLGIIRRRDGSFESLQRSGLPIGIFSSARYILHKTMLHEGDSILLYSDGLQDCLGNEQEALERVQEALGRQSTSAQETVGALVHAAKETEPLVDDVTMVLIRRMSEVAP